MGTKWRIHWKADKTGATGHGTETFSKEEAQREADGLNVDNEDWTTHWIESVEGKEEKPA